MKSTKIKVVPLPKELKGRKGSEVFLEYSQPYLELVFNGKEPDELDELEMVLRIPWIIWNASVMGKMSEGNVDYLPMMQRLLKNTPIEMKNLVDFMIERKKTLYSQYSYMLGEYTLRFDEAENDLKLSVETRMPPKKNGK